MWKIALKEHLLFLMLSNLMLERVIIFLETIVKILEIKLNLILGKELTFVVWEMSRAAIATYRSLRKTRRCAWFPGREIYRLIRAFGFASQRDFVVRSGARTEEKQSQGKSASIQCPYSLRSYVTECYLDTGAYPRKTNADHYARRNGMQMRVCCSVAKHFRSECHKHGDRSSGRPVFGTNADRADYTECQHTRFWRSWIVTFGYIPNGMEWKASWKLGNSTIDKRNQSFLKLWLINCWSYYYCFCCYRCCRR